MSENILQPDYLFETSWEVCNKIGGIHTVVTSKALEYVQKFGDKYILFGPDIIRDDIDHPEFEEDNQLYKDWRTEALNDGMGIKVGRWKIPSKPVVVLVDFTKFINQKDLIFTQFWETYKLDSISGQWDYAEPALFGYAVGKVIESFVQYYMKSTEKIIAQFHEWMTGTGVLYLKHNQPRIATVFTTHATVLGRSLAGNNKPLYDKIDTYDPAEVAKMFNVISKDSLERSAAINADCFTTVSDITGNECEKLLGKKPDIITPNGFDNTIVSTGKTFDEKRASSRKKIINAAEKLLGYSLSDDVVMTAISGRYEFKNKGIDLFLDSLGKLNSSNDLQKEVIGWFLIPANHYGPRKDLKRNISEEISEPLPEPYLTHNLHYVEYDPILKKLKELNLTNAKENKVKVIFVPSYLNGDDGIFNLHYYDYLMGLDLTVFPSYYEPWGYTPLESLAYHVPSITTTVAGFGKWVIDHYKEPENGLKVITRNDINDVDVVNDITNFIVKFTNLSKDEIQKATNKAFDISNIALWKNFINEYWSAYSLALDKVEKRAGYKGLDKETQTTRVQKIPRPIVNTPKWTRITVLSNLPDKLKLFNEIIQNLWWSWYCPAIELFEEIDPEMWQRSGRNPILLFDMVDFSRLQELEKDKEFLQRLKSVHQHLKGYLARKDFRDPKIAYFSMEFGLQDSLKIYSGGLGILAGDYLKEASDSNINITAIGLLYRYGYFKQMLSVYGDQIVAYEPEDFTKVPISPVRDENGNFITITIALPGRKMYARLWKVNVGRVDLYLLDTDFDANTEEDKYITHQLYGGDHENRLKQEILLGIGGIRALEALGIKPHIYHSNEGHSAFIGLERLRKYINEDNLTFYEAKEVVRASTLFTTHTPVPAGHDAFTEELLRKYIAHYPDRLKITWDELMSLGKANSNDPHEKFNMSYLAAHLSQEVNGVSMLHGKVTRDMFSILYKGYLPEELYIGHVTNGVHYPTWVAKDFRRLFNLKFGDFFEEDLTNKKHWEKVYDIDDEEIWDVKKKLKRRLISYIKMRFRDNWVKRHENPQQVIEIIDKLDDTKLTIGFARRFATYKRAHLLFNNLERLSDIVNNPDRPVQFLFAGKAHPHDKAGQDLIKRVVSISKMPEFMGKILFLQNYDMELGRQLVQGVDIWLNTPTRPLEASGTSGEKAVMNGTLHFSVLDGWWVEGYEPGVGWALSQERTYDNQEFQDKLDAETIYSIIENEIAPAYYEKNRDGLSVKWVGFMKNSFAKVAPKFTTTRMIFDYRDQYYSKLFERTVKVVDNDFKMAKEIAQWKAIMSKNWHDIKVVNTDILQKDSDHYLMNMEYKASVELDLGDIDPEDIGVEILVTEHYYHVIQHQELEWVSSKNDHVIFETFIKPLKPGTFDYGLRIFPKNINLPHRQDFGFLKWI